MIVSDSKRFVFIHVQKTGGSSVSLALLDGVADARSVPASEGGGKHAPLGRVLRHHPELSDHFVFGFVRNPWARLYSWHEMVRRRARLAPHRLEQVAFWGGVAERYPTFESFVLEAPEEFPRLARPQLHYLRTKGRRADFIGRTESLEDDFRRVAARLDIEIAAVPRTNTGGPPRSYREHYTPAMRDRVAEVFAEDVAEFGYEF